MKFWLIALVIVSIGSRSSAQDITGQWHGTLDVGVAKLRMVLHLTKAANGYTATMDSPDQGAKGMPVGSVAFSDSVLRLDAPAIGVIYRGRLQTSSRIEGTFSQAGHDFPLHLEKSSAAQRIRQPEPADDIAFPYTEEQVTFRNEAAGIALAGTLSVPKQGQAHPAVILVSGSGPQTRDQEIFGHKIFRVIADHLARRGFAVLRYDDRGVGASGGAFATATIADFTGDAAAAFSFLKSRKEILPEKIGFLGHSEGGIVSYMVAANNQHVAFLVLLAAPGIPIDAMVLQQTEMIGRASGASEAQLKSTSSVNRQIYQAILTESDSAALRRQLTILIKPVFEAAVKSGSLPAGQVQSAMEQQVNQAVSPYMRHFLKIDPAVYLRQVACPVLALNGTKDMQVSAPENLAGIRKALGEGGNMQVTTKELPGLNHLFQESKTGSPAEYAGSEHPVSPLALAEISGWLSGL